MAPEIAFVTGRLGSPWRPLAELARADGAGLALAISLAALNFFLLPKAERWRLRAPLFLLAGHVVCLGLTSLFDSEDGARAAVSYTGLFLLYSCNGVSLFLLATQLLLRRYCHSLSTIFLDIGQGLLYCLALLATLHAAGVELASLLTGSALVTAVIGLSLRDTLGNLFAGVSLQAQRPFALGDWIQFTADPKQIGQVVEINWRATTVLTLDAVEISVPNAALASGHIINYSRPQAWSRRSIYFHAPYDISPQRVHEIILHAVSGAWGVLENPAPSVVSFDFDEAGVRYWLRFFTAEFAKRDIVDGGVRDRVWYALNRHGIAIPSPLRTVRLEQAVTSHEREAERVAQRVTALREVDFFAVLPDDSLVRLGAGASARLYGAGETVLRQGESGEELFLILRGEVTILLAPPGGTEVELARLGQHSFFGEMSLLTGEPRSATVRAARDCELLVVDKAAFAEALHGSPELAERVSETIASRQANQADKREAARGGPVRGEEARQKLLRRIREFFKI